ncbi:bifunctional diguanylate cyclase/phosphodiesterase [Ferirhizobium litorale]|uniref:Bifunctional diguanylate cyclase/phosphodiesterase n=1 Tax=Ferirhizobium litorale TaxID=2927786 RepID=A0AAE3U1R9_9HYPH|nr:bifunctional diguanylate cyclase/phosphodiesterase [Fererhizobium litorale]MDI7920578.1 bifunctional diguanylate cyclase/phosphodiesterase [Fererhizobium litorale]
MRSLVSVRQRFTNMGRRPLLGGVLLAFALVVVVVTSLVLSALGEVARHANQLDDARSHETTAGALKTFEAQLGATLNDYAAWDDATQYVYAPDGMEWMISNFGDMTVDSDLFDVAVVADVDGNAVMAYREGQPMTGPVDRYFGGSLRVLFDLAKASENKGMPQATGFIETESGIAATGVALIRMKSGELSLPRNMHRYLIFARHLDARKVEDLAQTYVISGLTLAPSVADPRSFVPIRDPSGKILAKLAWASRNPGDVSYMMVQPTVFMAIGLVGLLFVVLLAIGALAARRMKADEAAAVSLARHDRLSGLVNRSGLFTGLEEMIDAARVDSSDVLLLYLDLDGFKEVNDAYGHGTGDQLIRGVAAGLSYLTPQGASVARVGGDEFAIALQTTRIDEQAVELVEALLDFFSEPLTIGARVATVGASIGIASSPRGLISAGELVRRADMAMYKAKDAGRGRCMCYEPGMDADRETRNELELDLRQAIENGDLRVAFQPLVSASNREIVAVEALVRWNRPGHGAVSPDVFIPIAETTGLIEPLGLYVLRRACEEAHHWPAGVNIAVNISPGQFRNPAFADQVGAIIGETGTDASRITLEMTEGYLIQNPERARQAIDRLKALGLRVALDDFGAGFASVGYLRQFGFDRMKIDRSLVLALDESSRARDMLQATVALARSLDIPVTAEGIEREDQAMILHLCGCDELQGYLFGKPMPAEAINAIFAGTDGAGAGGRSAA